jgi:hypothetical protein
MTLAELGTALAVGLALGFLARRIWPAPSGDEWAHRWADLRRRGRSYFLWRNCVETLSAGLVMAVFAALAQRAFAQADAEIWSWAFCAFVFVSATGVINAWWQWRANERRYQALQSHKGS